MLCLYTSFQLKLIPRCSIHAFNLYEGHALEELLTSAQKFLETMSLFKIKIKNKSLALQNKAKYFQ